MPGLGCALGSGAAGRVDEAEWTRGQALVRCGLESRSVTLRRKDAFDVFDDVGEELL